MTKLPEQRRQAFLQTLRQFVQGEDNLRGVVQALRTFGYLQEIDYGFLMTSITTHSVRMDGVETLEQAKTFIRTDTTQTF